MRTDEEVFVGSFLCSVRFEAVGERGDYLIGLLAVLFDLECLSKKL